KVVPSTTASTSAAVRTPKTTGAETRRGGAGLSAVAVRGHRKGRGTSCAASGFGVVTAADGRATSGSNTAYSLRPARHVLTLGNPGDDPGDPLEPVDEARTRAVQQPIGDTVDAAVANRRHVLPFGACQSPPSGRVVVDARPGDDDHLRIPGAHRLGLHDPLAA